MFRRRPGGPNSIVGPEFSMANRFTPIGVRVPTAEGERSVRRIGVLFVLWLTKLLPVKQIHPINYFMENDTSEIGHQ